MIWEHTLCDFCSFKFATVYLKAQNVISLSEYSLWIWEECVFSCCCMEYSINVKLIDAVQFNYALTDLLPPDCQLLIEGYWSSNYMHGFIRFSLPLFQLLSQAFDIVLLGAYICRAAIFLKDWPLSWFCNTLFVPNNFSFSEICSVQS